MNILFGLGIIFHTGVLLFSCVVVYGLVKNSKNVRNQLTLFLRSLLVSFLISIIGIIVLATVVPDLRTSQMAVLGCTGVPIIPAIMVWVSYVGVQVMKRKGFEIDTSMVIWGVVVSAPLGFLAGSIYTNISSL